MLSVCFQIRDMGSIHSEEPIAYTIHRNSKDAWKFNSETYIQRLAIMRHNFLVQLRSLGFSSKLQFSFYGRSHLWYLPPFVYKVYEAFKKENNLITKNKHQLLKYLIIELIWNISWNILIIRELCSITSCLTQNYMQTVSRLLHSNCCLVVINLLVLSLNIFY